MNVIVKEGINVANENRWRFLHEEGSSEDKTNGEHEDG